MQAKDVASLISSLREVEQGKSFGGFTSHTAESLLRVQQSDARAPPSSIRGGASIKVDGASTQSTLGLQLAASKSKLIDPVGRGEESISSAALVQEIVQGSKLLNKTSHLPPHLQTFKKDFERLQEKKIKLPTIHQQLTPRTRKRISQLPPASEKETSAVEKYVSLAKSISGSKAYENLADAVTKSRIKAQRRQIYEPEQMVENEGKTRGGGAGERVLMPLPSLADLGLSQEDLTRHDSTAFFAKLEEYRKQDAIKASIALRWAPSGEDDTVASSLDAGGVSILGGGNNSSVAETHASKQYPFDSDLTSLLAQKASGRKPPNESAIQVKEQEGEPGSSSTSDVYRKLYSSISETNERGQLVYDDYGNLRPKTLATSYSEVFDEASQVHGSISTRFQHLQREFTTARVHKMQFIKAEKSLLDEIKTRCYDDLGLDLDSKFTAVRIASKAVNMMMFYMVEVRLKGSFLKLKEQTRLASIARRERASRLLNRVGRGMLARADVRKLRRMVYSAREHERRTVETRSTEYRKAASCITRAIRLYTRMKIIRRRRRQRLAATCIQRRIRGIIARVRVYRLQNWNEWLRLNAVKIQCMARQRFARRRAAVLRKIRTVKMWEADAAISQKMKAEHLRRVGAAAYIIHCYRAYKIRRKLKIIIYWHRVELAIVIQKWVRGYFDRKFVKRIKRRKFERERIVREAAVAIQKIVRGRQARLNQYKPRLAIKVKELLAKRKAKSKYLKEAAKNNAMRVLYGTLRTFIPFRYVILARKATVIQRFYRGYRARKRVFLMKVQATITKMNRKYFGGYNGALQFQRVYRGYRYRRDKIRAKRKAAAILIQCAFRCSQARWKVIQKKIHRDAMILIGKNILSLMRFKKAEKIRRENRKYRYIVVKLQRLARRYLGRLRFHAIKTDKRSQFERDKVNDLRLNNVLASVQLRIIMESIERPLGEKPRSCCSSDCYALGPIQAIFCAAVGKKARLEHTALPTNKIDSSSILKFAAKIKGFMENGRPLYEKVDDLYKPPKPEQEESGTGTRKGAGAGGGGGQGSRLQSKGPKGPRGGGKGRKRVEKVKTRMHPPGQFALIDAIRSRAIDIISATKPLNKLDLEMVFAKSCDGGQKELRYPDFITFVRAAAKINYAVPDEDDASVSTAAAQRAYEAKMANLSAERVDDATVDSSLADDSTSAGGRWDDLTLEGDDDEDDDADDGEKSAATAERAMKEKRREARLKKKKQATKKQSKSRAKVGDGKLLWPLKDITSKTNPNHAVLLLITFLDSWRSQEWWLDLADWMEQEARARVAVYVKKMQNLYWHMKSAAFRALMRDRLGAKKRIEEYTQVVVIIQSWVRRFICKARVQRLAQVFLVKYIPDVGEPYWFNRSTNVTSYTRPLILGPYDCLSVAMPPTGLEFVIQCSNCTATAVRNCWECEDSYCKKCYDNLHCKGKRRFHHTYSIPMCGYCKFQMASKCCVTCMSIKPEPGSAQEQMKESDRGNLCDYCFSHLHDESEQHFWEDEGSIEKKENMRRIFARSREAYLVKQELGGGGGGGSIATDHKFDSTVQECEECNFRAASWRCNDCKQIYCNKCLVGLHSIGGPFSAHKAEKLPFYTGEMHRSFLNDQRAQIFQTKMEVVKRAWAQRADAFRYRSIVRIQAWWRMHFHGRKGRLQILRGRKKARRQWRLRIAEKEEREGLRYKFLDLFGMAPELLSDTREEQVLKRISVFGRQFAREFVWKNKDSWGFYTDKDSKDYKKGEPNKGFESGDVEELKSQARRGGFRMPGRILLCKGEQKHTTTHDLREFLKNGMLVRIGGAFFAVRHVSESSLRLDRIWRWESVLPDGELIYRLPAFSDEARRNQYKALYYLSNFAISNPISQSYFRTHASVFEQLKGAAEWMEQAHKTLGFRRGSVEWRRYAAKLERRAKWANDMIDEQVDAVDLSKQKSVKAKKAGEEGGGGAVAAALMAAAEAGEIALPEADSDDEEAGKNKPKERAPGERYYATEEELAHRLAIEAAMSEEDLIATADDWEECIDVMTENIFYTNRNTFEMVPDKPAALKLKIARDERLDKERKQVDDARLKILSAKGLNAHGKKKGASGMSGARK